MLLNTILSTLEYLAPLAYAEPRDNVGLLAGDPDQELSRVMLTIDMTRSVVDEALSQQCQLVVAYHPPIFEGLKRIDARSSLGVALRQGLAIYSPHTALDAASGGTNDVLADCLGLEQRQALRPIKADLLAQTLGKTPSRDAVVGMGRLGVMAPLPVPVFAAHVKARLGLEQVLIAGPTQGTISKVAVAAGAAGDLLKAAIRLGAEAVVCGELRHHDALAAAAAGVTVICARHSMSERQALQPLATRLRDRHSGLSVLLSQQDADPFRFA